MAENDLAAVYTQFHSSPIHYILASLDSFFFSIFLKKIFFDLLTCFSLLAQNFTLAVCSSARRAPAIGLAGSFSFFIHNQHHLLAEAFLDHPS